MHYIERLNILLEILTNVNWCIIMKLKENLYSLDDVKGRADLESKIESHMPKVDMPDEITIGQPFNINIYVSPHPNTLNHSIRRIEVYFIEKGRRFNPILIASIDLTPTYIEPELTLKIKLDKPGILSVVSYCNLHGLWVYEKEVKVK